jgi:hypothetical protein
VERFHPSFPRAEYGQDGGGVGLTSGLIGFLMSDIVLDIKSLTRRFGTFTAVDGLSLSVTRIFWRISSLITH